MQVKASKAGFLRFGWDNSLIAVLIGTNLSQGCWPLWYSSKKVRRISLTQDPMKIAIVGFGPRGLAALEKLSVQVGLGDSPIEVDIFDPHSTPSAGPNFSPTEPDVCLLNLPIREVDLPQSPNKGVPQFGQWVKKFEVNEEVFVPRSVLGTYFTERFQALMANLPDDLTVTLRPLRVERAVRHDDLWQLAAEGSYFGPYDHVLLSLGQPKTDLDDQADRWREHAKSQGLDFTAAYPGKSLIQSASDWAGRAVAIRGLGLSSLDVIRMLTLGLGGQFVDGRYVASGREPSVIVPFSLDGHAPAPKPASRDIDALFDPTEDETKSFETALRAAVAGQGDEGLAGIFEVLKPVVSRILSETGAAEDDTAIDSWLTMEVQQAGQQETRGTVEAIEGNLKEAEGACPPSVGFTVGQVWRKWQASLRAIFDGQETNADIAKSLIAFDEGLKRYSYGAPVDNLRQLLILIDAGLVTPFAAEDPNIEPSEDGWMLEADRGAVTASVMIDSVLPPPVIGKVSEPVIQGLVEDGTLVPIYDGAGAHCMPDGGAINQNGRRVVGLSIVGRVTNGSTIADDSIHDCFGHVTERWARGVTLSGKQHASK